VLRRLMSNDETKWITCSRNGIVVSSAQ
jgi:hypothetical protein